MMRYGFHFDGVAASSREGIASHVQGWVERHLGPVLAGFGYEGSVLSVVVKRYSRRARRYGVKLHLHLPRRKVLVARAESADLRQAIDTALDRLLREVDRHVDRLRRQGDYKRRTRRWRLRELKRRLAAMPEAVVTEASSEIDLLIERLERVARREVAFLRACGDLPPDYPQVEDVVAEAVAAVKADWHGGQAADDLLQRLLEALYDVIDREIEASRLYGEMVSLESVLPPDAQAQAEAMVEEEIHEYWQPDEVLHLQDVVADDAVMGEGEGLDDTRLVYRLQLMEALPEVWRRALMLREFEGLDTRVIARIFAVAESVVERWIGQADDFLEARLAQAGLASTADVRDRSDAA